MATEKLTHEQISRIRLNESEAARSHDRFPLILILENIRSLYNVGSIFRTADALVVEAIYTVGYTPHPPRPEIEKTALGATRTVPNQHFDTIQEAVAAARDLGRKIAVLEIATESRSIFEMTPDDFPLALIIGNEITGVSATSLELSDIALEIPMLGSKHSLNVAVATGVALFECLRVVNPKGTNSQT